MTNKTYDILKYLALIVFPAVGALYFALAKIWGLPYATEIVGTIAAIDTFLGAILKISSDKYYDSEQDIDGYIDIEGTEDAGEWTIDLDKLDLNSINHGSTIKLKIKDLAVPTASESSYQGKH